MIIFFFFFFFSDKLRSLRKESNLTLAELSREVGIPASTLSMYEQGKRNPSKKNLEILANFFGVPESDLYQVKESNKSNTIFNFNNELMKYGITAEDILNLPNDKRDLVFRTLSDLVRTLNVTF